MPRQPAVFLGRGTTLLSSGEDADLAWLDRVGRELRAGSPRAVVCITAMEVTPKLALTSSDARLVRAVIEKLLYGKTEAVGDPNRPCDDATAAILSSIFGEDVPVVRMTLHTSLDPELHFAVGRAMEPLCDEGFCIVGLGAVTNEPTNPDARVLPEASRRFQSWVVDLLSSAQPYTRARGLTRYREHPDARLVHPNERALLPLLVVAGAASSDRSPQNVAELLHAGVLEGRSTASFRFRK